MVAHVDRAPPRTAGRQRGAVGHAVRKPLAPSDRGYDDAVRIDLNVDCGEGLDVVDAELLPLVSSVNIACGGHAGDRATMERTVHGAARLGLAIGAHPGYPDREGFGRRRMDLGPEMLAAEIERQVRDLLEVVEAEGAELVHVKPHGALYNEAGVDPDLAAVVARAVHDVRPDLVLVGLPGSALLDAGREAGLRVAAEAFADRAYEPDGRLRSRSRPGAVHAHPDLVAAQAVSIARDGRVPLEGGGWLAVVAETLCLHSDSPNAVASARAVRHALDLAGIAVAPLERP